MLAILNSLNAHNFFQPILMILVAKFMVHRVLSDKTYLGQIKKISVFWVTGLKILGRAGKFFFFWKKI